jgi:sterol desaturase/sphingolipid hydroxylase (fatty acid hydroxylase superfamily)
LLSNRGFWKIAGFTALIALLAVLVFMDAGARLAAVESLRATGTSAYRTLVSELLLNPWFYGVIALVLLLEQLIPAHAQQPSFSTGLRTDLLWTVTKIVLQASLLPIYPILMKSLYDRHLGFLTVHGVADWPWLGRVMLALLLGDLIFWFTHVVRHKVKSFWYFHAVHHSQKELNFFTEYRVHPIDDVFISTIGFIPLFMFSHSFTTVVAVVWIRHWHTRLYHANIRSNFGWLRYVLVTPQSHRVHHSVEPRHADRNFGLTFSLWDQLFGTQYRGWNEYPETGIPDGDFPWEQNASRSGPRVVLEQIFYPFRALLRDGSAS